MNITKSKSTQPAIPIAHFAAARGLKLDVQKRDITEITAMFGKKGRQMFWFASIDGVMGKSNQDYSLGNTTEKMGYLILGSGPTKKVALQRLALQLSERFVYVNWEEEKLPKLKA